ncbi:3-deoxy-d-manno-octulosonic acid hydrolase subunit 1 [Helicobacter pylori]|uniref:3-deoxy-d-manno-octulosonic acid hydrolase subunit 1 n=1 Tax=Helicobacter pylori TaxID=210 RepID=UPI001125D8F2|nr:3-deoxy-d-manno-octulosonic acid hydrolase subunit 1 [Helicobacter pylori]TPH56577.1 3-deoxy-d-manno-octulosonic acid hydrolase subunit 1 [Helicobacter pylori]
MLISSSYTLSFAWLFLIFFFFKNKALSLRFSLSLISVILSNIALKDSLSLNEFLSSFTAPLSPFSCLLILAYVIFSCRLLQKPPLETLQSYSVMLFFNLLLLTDILGFLPFSIYHHFMASLIFSTLFCSSLFLSSPLLGLIALVALSSSLLMRSNFQILDSLLDFPLLLFVFFKTLSLVKKRLY